MRWIFWGADPEVAAAATLRLPSSTLFRVAKRQTPSPLNLTGLDHPQPPTFGLRPLDFGLLSTFGPSAFGFPLFPGIRIAYPPKIAT